MVYLIAVITAALFCFSGCSNENQMKQFTPKPPLTEEMVEKVLKKYGDDWKPYDLKMDERTKTELKSNVYGFEDDDGLRWIVETYKKQGATYLSITTSPFRLVAGKGTRKQMEEKLPDMFGVACKLYDDGIDPKEFEAFWDTYNAKKERRWRKAVGDNIISVYLSEDMATFTHVSIEKKSFTDWGSISATKFMLWGNQDVSIEKYISTTNDITENKAVPIKSCYIVNGDIVDTKKLAEVASLPDEKEIFSKLHRSFSVSKTGEYNVVTIKDTSGKIEVIIPATPISESEYKEFKHFVIYEYHTDKGRLFYMLDMTRSLNDPPK